MWVMRTVVLPPSLNLDQGKREFHARQPAIGPMGKHFYFIWNPNALRPSTRYWTAERAKRQAEELRKTHQDQEFIVYHAFLTNL